MIEGLHKNGYSVLRDEIITKALFFSRKITTFSMLEELNELHAMFCYSQQELNTTSDEKLIIISQLIINKMREFIYDMGEYGVNDDALSSFLNLLEQFQLSIDNGSGNVIPVAGVVQNVR
jgi:hypothetical protein